MFCFVFIVNRSGMGALRTFVYACIAVFLHRDLDLI